jgi:2,4-dienoyl-CoA reductase-like NADH-dependent reductase (Old Yellow Enzyme family)
MEMREMLYCIGETGLLNFVDIDTGHCWGEPSYVPSSYHPHAEFREVGKAARADLDPKIAVLFTGRINDPVLAEELIRNGYCDLVGMVRAGIADPIANQAREGRLGEIAAASCPLSTDIGTYFTPIHGLLHQSGDRNELLWKRNILTEVSKQVVVVGRESRMQPRVFTCAGTR